MATIRASCDTCGDVEFPTTHVQVQAPANGGSGTYTFTCPTCQRQVVRTAERPIMDLLIAAGVASSTWQHPAHSAGIGLPPLTHADLVDFHEAIHDDDAVAQALDALIRARPAGGDTAL